MYQVFTQQHVHRLRLVWHTTDIIRLGTNSSIAFISTMWGFDLRGNFVKPATPTSMSAAFHQSTLRSFSPTEHIFLSQWRHSRVNYMAQPDAAEVFHVCCCDSKKQSFIKAGVFHNVICEDTQYSYESLFHCSHRLQKCQQKQLNEMYENRVHLQFLFGPICLFFCFPVLIVFKCVRKKHLQPFVHIDVLV